MEIIIDDIDVSGCEFLRNCIIPDNYGCKIDDSLCCDVGNCYYKQLKRKEQEYEELRQYHNKCCEENAKKETEWLEKFNQISIGFYNGDYCNTEHCSLLRAKEQECERLKNERTVDLVKQLDQLKAENEHLSEKEEEARHYLEEAEKFKNCLIEIKKIAEKTLNMVDYKTYFKRDNKSLKQESFKAIDKILQKISEVLDEKEMGNNTSNKTTSIQS